MKNRLSSLQIWGSVTRKKGGMDAGQTLNARLRLNLKNEDT